LFTNDKGEYHIDLEKYNELGEIAAKELAAKEIELKVNSDYTNKTINFDQARKLGFCEYGIKDFCKMLNLDIDKDHNLKEVNKALTIEALKSYPDECIKLFGENTLKYLGGVKGVLNEDTIDLVLRPEFIPEKTLHKLSVVFAYQNIANFEKE